jgi:hypothetical protein
MLFIVGAAQFDERGNALAKRDGRWFLTYVAYQSTGQR